VALQSLQAVLLHVDDLKQNCPSASRVRSIVIHIFKKINKYVIQVTEQYISSISLHLTDDLTYYTPCFDLQRKTF